MINCLLVDKLNVLQQRMVSNFDTRQSLRVQIGQEKGHSIRKPCARPVVKKTIK